MSDINGKLMNIIDISKIIFVFYILTLIKIKILPIDKAINIFFGFYKINHNILEDYNFVLRILTRLESNEEENSKKLSKYITFIYVISKINKDKLKFINLVNNSNLYKIQNRKININEYDICNGELYHNCSIFKCLEEEVNYLKKYLESYEFLKKNTNFTFGFINSNKDSQNIHKDEIINRFILINEKLGERLINFLINKPSRKNVTEINFELFGHDILIQMQYTELLRYSHNFFNKLNLSLDSYLKDFEFSKYLQIILISFIEDNKDKVTQKLHNKLLKKYIFNKS